MSVTLLTTAILMGLTGSLHCAGMCGPIMLVLPFQTFTPTRKMMAIGLYHAGRISVYMAMGMVMFAFKSLFHPQWQQIVSLLLGALLLGLGLLGFLTLGMQPLRMPWSGWVQQQMKKVLAQPGLPAVWAMGMLNGLLPCGLVYLALSASITAESYGHAALFMLLFGLGTTPMLVGITLLRQQFQRFVPTSARRLVPFVLMVMGGLILVRGMNLGIPYLSPKMTQAADGKVKSSCCEKPKHE